MPVYDFALRNDAEESENLGAMALADDDEAIDFGRETIGLIMKGDASEYAAAVMEINEGDRAVAQIPLAQSNA